MSLLSYLLLISIISIFFIKNQYILIGILLVITTVSFFQNTINIYALAMLITFAGICYATFSTTNKTTHFLLLCSTTIMLYYITKHKLPGFTNPIFITPTRVSEASSFYFSFLNVDKILSTLILFTTGKFYLKSFKLNRQDVKITLLTTLSCIFTILLPAILVGYIKFDPKVPSILLPWVIHNLFFVCCSEEIIFRMYLQNNIEQMLPQPKASAILSLVIASCLFALYHFDSGIVMMALAGITGLFYGYSYQKTNNIIPAILVHFLLNFCHFIFFTYPHVR